MSSETKRSGPEKLANAALNAVAAYAVGKAALSVAHNKRAESDFGPEEKVPVAEAAVPQSSDSHEVLEAKANYADTVRFFRDYVDSRYSRNKLIPREMHYNPWAYGHEPSWRSLHKDQTSEIAKAGKDTDDYRFKVGMDALVAYGHRPVNTAVRRRMHEHNGNTTILFDAQTVDVVTQEVNTATADRKVELLEQSNVDTKGIAAAMLGLGFDTDLKVAQYQDGSKTHQLVPFSISNELHRRVTYDLAIPKDAGLVLTIDAGKDYRHQDASVSVKLVNINSIRDEWARHGSIIPDKIPDPQVLANAA